MKVIFLIITCLFVFMLPSLAQFVNFGQDRPGIRWKQIDTDHFQIIYPDFFEKKAQKAANIYSQLYRHANTLQLHPKKISIILHADGGVSNGNVSLVPRKSELYTTPPQDPTDSWLEHLCVHEFRHVIQLDKVNQGMTKGLYYVFGELFPIAMVGLYVPMWFMEGDAVCYETAIGHIGRGRSPEFLNEMKAQIVEKGIYSFYKAVLGSYKDFVPNRYNMGYFMTANARANYGPFIWAKALEEVGRRPYELVPFSKGLKRTMKGKRDSLWNTPTFRSLFTDPDSMQKVNTYANAKRTLYRDNFSELRQIWKKEVARTTSSFDTVPTHNKYYTNYYYPTADKTGGLITYKKGLQQSGAFVRLQNGKEKLITRTGVLDDYKFSVHSNRIVWAEYRPHIRWEQGGRMTLASYDPIAKKYKRHKSLYNRFSPFGIGKNWGCVEVNDCNQASIVIVDSTFRNELQRIPALPDELFIHPSYANGKIITVVQSPQGLNLESIDPETGFRQKISEKVYYEIDNPIQIDTTLLFRASFNGNNSFYRQTSGFSKPIHLLEAPYGIRFPFYHTADDSLYFSFYTADGYKPGKIKFTDLTARPAEWKNFRLAEEMKKQEDWTLPLYSDSTFSSRKYNKFTHLVNIHSWGPLDIDLNDMSLDIGAVVYSQNKLSTLSFTAGYVLKSGYDHGAWIFNASYRGWWPIFDLELQSGRYDEEYRSVQAYRSSNNKRENLLVDSKAWQSSADLVLRLPFNLSVRNYNRSLQPYIRYKLEAIHGYRPQKAYSYTQNRDTLFIRPVSVKDYEIHLPSRYYQLLEYGLIFNNQTRMTEQEFNPRWGQRLSGGFTHSPLKGIYLGSQWWCDTRFYLPGFAVNHSWTLYGGFQQMSEKRRNYGNKIRSPRGISLRGYEIASFRGSYELPLFYPDRNISSLVYFKRINGALFFDAGRVHNLLWKKTFYSSGIELTTDTHFFNLTYPIHFGIRTGYETQHKKFFADFIFSIGLSI